MQHVFFCRKGCWDSITLDDNGKRTHHSVCTGENWLISDRDSLFFSGGSIFYPGRWSIEVLMIEQTLILNLAKKDEGFHEFNPPVVAQPHQAIAKEDKVATECHGRRTLPRFYGYLPDLMLRLPQTMVASYLGIAPESLSRVRKVSAGRKKPATFFLT